MQKKRKVPYCYQEMQEKKKKNEMNSFYDVNNIRIYSKLISV